MNSIYDEVTDFLSAKLAEELVAFRPSEAAQDRFEELIAREKREGLLPEETAELDRTIEANRFLSMAKAKAILKLSQAPSKAA